jgi:type II secretory pathway component PulM
VCAQFNALVVTPILERVKGTEAAKKELAEMLAQAAEKAKQEEEAAKAATGESETAPAAAAESSSKEGEEASSSEEQPKELQVGDVMTSGGIDPGGIDLSVVML